MWTHYAYRFAQAPSVERDTPRYTSWVPRFARLMLSLLLVIAVASKLAAQSTEEFDSYKLRLAGDWVYSTPTGSFQGSADTDKGAIDLTADWHFNTYSTLWAGLDWKFTHKNHIYVLEVGSLLLKKQS